VLVVLSLWFVYVYRPTLQEMTQEYQRTHSNAWPARLKNLIFKGVLFDTEVGKILTKRLTLPLILVPGMVCSLKYPLPSSRLD
jgi:hypothetical protein